MSCDHLQGDRLVAVEDGAPPDEHEQTCADCTEARRKYQRVGELIADAGADRQLPAAWFDATLAMVQTRPRRVRTRRLVVGAAGVVAAAAAAFLLWPRHRETHDTGPPLVAVRIERGGATLRGSAPHPGDLLVVHARGAGRRHLELRVYRADRELVLRCADDLACRPSGDVVDASVTLAEAGRYRAVLLSSDRPLPAAGATLDQAASQVDEQGGVATLSEAIDIL